MKRSRLTCAICVLLSAQIACAADKTRLIIMADMGNEPDEEQQMIHIILEVLDENQEIGMYDYRRVVLKVM